FAKQLVEVEKGKKEPVIHVGNLEARRDFSDVRDIVRGYWLALEHCEPGEVYNICSGKDYSIQAVLDRLIELSGVEVDRCPLDPGTADVDSQHVHGDRSFSCCV
ncbi:MAG: GDP-mannose 4,6-dehydratase, partial [Deltaproteobacteria bacterium]|nr:GDP-mannose 4,6-dehydratase [Deltaproteobacteria bacterium]